MGWRNWLRRVAWRSERFIGCIDLERPTMTTETNGPEPRLKKIFADALERQNAADRDQYLTEACGGDAALRAQVESLLAAHAQAGDFLEQSVLGHPASRWQKVPGP